MVVVVQVRRQAFLDGLRCCRGGNISAQTFILYCSVKALNVGVIVGSAHPAMAQGDTLGCKLVTEPTPKLGTVIRLKGGEVKRCGCLGTAQEVCGLAHANLQTVFGIGPARVDINQGIDVGSLLSQGVDEVHGVCLQQITWCFGSGPWHGWPVALPAFSAGVPQTPKDSLHTRQTHGCPFTQAVGVNHLGAAAEPLAPVPDARSHCIAQLAGASVWT